MMAMNEMTKQQEKSRESEKPLESDNSDKLERLV
jgi:hypothetical protein